MALPFRALYAMHKTVAGAPRWSDPDPIDKEIRITAALDVDQRTVRGLELVGRAKIDRPKGNISFSLLYHPSGNRRDAIKLARVDWRPVTPHTNTHPAAPAHLKMAVIAGSQHHSFDLNWASKEGRPLKWLPVAEPITPDYQGFTELLDGVGKFFRISNISSLPEPKWTQELGLDD